MVISAPFNVKHNIHVQVDPAAPTGFKGLPAEWDTMLSVSGISKAEVSALKFSDVRTRWPRSSNQPACSRRARVSIGTPVPRVPPSCVHAVSPPRGVATA